MTNLEKAVKTIVEDYKSDLDGYYSDWNIETWKEFVEYVYGGDSAQVKEDVRYTLNQIDICLNDYDELETEDGSFVSYRSLMNAVRKELKAQGYFK